MDKGTKISINSFILDSGGYITETNTRYLVFICVLCYEGSTIDPPISQHKPAWFNGTPSVILGVQCNAGSKTQLQENMDIS